MKTIERVAKAHYEAWDVGHAWEALPEADRAGFITAMWAAVRALDDIALANRGLFMPVRDSWEDLVVASNPPPPRD